MNILILNWRDPKNPNAGGAELLTQEMAKRWVKKGHQVKQISSSFKNAKRKEIIDGVEFIRWGRWWNVHIYAYFYYFRYLRSQTDIIIDEVHWFPFFSKLYAPDKTVALVCEVANKLFYKIFPYPIAVCWRLIEKIYLVIYKNVPTLVISDSTRKDLIREGHLSSNITVLPMGLTVTVKLKPFPKEKNPTLISVARLNKQKGIFEILDAFAQVNKSVPEAKLWLVGSGEKDIVTKIQEEIKEKRIDKSVILYGFVTEEKKFELLSRAHLLISASLQEGWGLTVPEAGLTKTPSVVYNTQGFRDIIDNEKDGVLTDPTPDSLAKGIVGVLQDKEKYKKLQIAIEKKAKSYSWDNTAEKALAVLTTQFKKL